MIRAPSDIHVVWCQRKECAYNIPPSMHGCCCCCWCCRCQCVGHTVINLFYVRIVLKDIAGRRRVDQCSALTSEDGLQTESWMVYRDTVHGRANRWPFASGPHTTRALLYSPSIRFEIRLTRLEAPADMTSYLPFIYYRCVGRRTDRPSVLLHRPPKE